MPNFDRMATAALTPGGVQAGVNDIIQAVMGRKAQEQQMAAKHEQMMYDRGMDQQRLELERQGLGAKIAAQNAENKYREDSLNLERQKAQMPKEPKQRTQAEEYEDDVREANLRVFGSADIGKGLPYERDEVRSVTSVDKDFMPQTLFMPTGQKEMAFRPPSADQIAQRDGIIRELQARRQPRGNENSVGAQTVQSLTASPAVSPAATPPPRKDGPGGAIAGLLNMSAPPAAPDQTATSTVPAAAAQQPLDYNSEDAKLKARKDPLGLAYSQMRSKPEFDWQGWIAKKKAEGKL